jgi:excisionase family DNA binding protein
MANTNQIILSSIDLEELQNNLSRGLEQKLVNILSKLSLNTQEHHPTEDKEVFLSVKQVQELLNISTSTVKEWTKKGVLTAYRIQKRIYYKRSEIDAALVEVKGANVNYED